ncbi:MAG: 50S ribosomal protein L22 [Alphaproteobacteria bacterium]|nr:50S ribosomal protein L22 [Alphaproteobacteria bacterium]
MTMVEVNNKKEAMAKARAIRTSPRKLNLVAASIRGMAVGKALSELSFSKRRVAQDVKKVLMSAIANAENNHNLDVDRLFVAESYVGKAMIMKRFHPMAKGRAGKIIKAFSNLTIIVREKEEKV